MTRTAGALAFGRGTARRAPVADRDHQCVRPAGHGHVRTRRRNECSGVPGRCGQRGGELLRGVGRGRRRRRTRRRLAAFHRAHAAVWRRHPVSPRPCRPPGPRPIRDAASTGRPAIPRGEALSTNQRPPRGVRQHRHRRRDHDGRVDPRRRKTSSAATAHVSIAALPLTPRPQRPTARFTFLHSSNSSCRCCAKESTRNSRPDRPSRLISSFLADACRACALLVAAIGMRPFGALHLVADLELGS